MGGRRPRGREKGKARVLVRLGDCTAKDRVEGISPLAAGEGVFGGCGALDDLLSVLNPLCGLTALPTAALLVS